MQLILLAIIFGAEPVEGEAHLEKTITEGQIDQTFEEPTFNPNIYAKQPKTTIDVSGIKDTLREATLEHAAEAAADITNRNEFLNGKQLKEVEANRRKDLVFAIKVVSAIVILITSLALLYYFEV
eukprot:NODE_567_length_5957_cov_0.651588.p5 type:complete len:125 gc:universal NODE_567_length_5957_cov_0.651588:5471-5097(-)